MKTTMMMKRTIYLLVLITVITVATAPVVAQMTSPAKKIQILTSDPATCVRGYTWVNSTTNLFKVCTAPNTISVFTTGGISQATADARYLKLAADNDPLTGQLNLAATGLQFPGSTSGTIDLIATAIAGTSTLTLPAATDTLVGKATTDTLTNKTINLTSNTLTSTSLQLKTAVTDETGSGALVFATSPALTTPTGIVKNDVGLGNVDNTSDATKNAAAVTLTNKTIDLGSNTVTATSAQVATAVSNETGSGLLVFGTSPAITTPTGIVKGDVGLGNVDNTSDATKNAAAVTLTNKTFDLGSNTLTATSAQLRAALSDETGTGAAVFATDPTLDGGITFSGTAKFFLADFSNATASNRFLFKTSTANSDTNVGIVPNGSGTQGKLTVFNTSDAANTSLAQLLCGSSACAILAGKNGSGTALPFQIQTNSGTIAWQADTSQIITYPALALTAGTMTATSESVSNTATTCRSWTNAMVTALPTTAGDIAFGTLPAKYIVRNAYVVITGAAVGPTTVTVAVGRTSASYIDYIVASDAKAAVNTVYGDVSAERGTNLTGYDLPSYTGTTVINAHFISTGANLSTVTGSTGQVCVTVEKLP